MSAIAGIIHFDGASIVSGEVEAMTAAMASRGPDGRCHWSCTSAAFGHCMLRTTPESLEEQQPLTDEDANLVLVMDGTLDNWQELRSELLTLDIVLRTRADAELVLRAYRQWGEECLAHIDGDFVFVVWDRHQQTVFCARDRMGSRQMHYWWDGKTLVFASAVNGLLQVPWVPRKRNDGTLVDFLSAQWCNNTDTFWQDVQRLPPAQYIKATAGRLQLRTYWQPDVWATVPCRSDADYASCYREQLADIVRRKSRSITPLSCEVSGGLDSSAVFAMAKQLEKESKLLAPAVEGYGLAFPDDADANELQYMRAVGRHWQCAIHEIPPALKSLQWYREEARRCREFPGYPNGVMNLAVRERAMQAGSRVVLSGLGGDEWLGGSRSYYADTLAAGEWALLLRCLKTDWQQEGRLASVRWLVRYGFLPQLPYALRASLRRLLARKRKYGVDRDVWLAPPLRKLALRRRLASEPRQEQSVARPGQRSQLNILRDYHYLQCHEYMERQAADLGLELRRPLSDPRLVQLAFSTPEHVRLRGDTDKYFHRLALQGLLPELVLQRQSKATFMGPFMHYLPSMLEQLAIEIPDRRPDWVSGQQVVRMHTMLGNTAHQGWPAWMLWLLFGCDAIFLS